jgi:hypothetical protein
MKRTPEELHNLAEAEKEKAIRLLNNALNVPNDFEIDVLRVAVGCIINSVLLYNAELQSSAMASSLEGGKKI